MSSAVSTELFPCIAQQLGKQRNLSIGMGGYTLQENPLISLIPELNLLTPFSLVQFFGKLAEHPALHAKAVIREIVPVTHSIPHSIQVVPHLSGNQACLSPFLNGAVAAVT